MPKKSFDQRLKERWTGKQNEKVSQALERAKKWDREFRQIGHIIVRFFQRERRN